MSLTDAELLKLKVDINANVSPVVVTALAQGAHGQIANWYNQEAVPQYYIFRNSVSSDEIRDRINASDVANITDINRGRTVDLLAIRADRGFSGADSDDRAAWENILSGAAGSKSRSAISLLWTRQGTYAEKVQSAGFGSGINPATADKTTWQGTLSSSDVSAALAIR